MKKHFEHALVLAVVFGLAGCAGTEVRKPAADASSAAEDFKRQEELRPGVFRGSYADSEADFTLLKSMGIRTIVSLRTLHWDIAPERKKAASHGMAFFNTPMEALPFEPGQKEVNAALDDIGDPAHQPVFFHCKLGRDRTGMVAALYRVIYEGWNHDEAFAEWEKFGFTGPFLYSGLKRYFNQHQDPMIYWKRNPKLVGLKDFNPAQSCASYRNLRGGNEAICSVAGASLTADTLLRAVSIGGQSQAGTILLVLPPAAVAADAATDPWAQCKQLHGHQEDLHGPQGRRIDVCRFDDGSAVDPAGLASSGNSHSPLVEQLLAWKPASPH